MFWKEVAEDAEPNHGSCDGANRAKEKVFPSSSGRPIKRSKEHQRKDRPSLVGNPREYCENNAKDEGRSGTMGFVVGDDSDIIGGDDRCLLTHCYSDVIGSDDHCLLTQCYVRHNKNVVIVLGGAGSVENRFHHILLCCAASLTVQLCGKLLHNEADEER